MSTRGSSHIALDFVQRADPDGVIGRRAYRSDVRDVALGDPFRVACGSIEVLHVVSHSRLMLGYDSNLPNKGRNPSRADDAELIVVDVPGLRP